MARLGIVTGLISRRVSPATDGARQRNCKFKYIYQDTRKDPDPQ